MNFFDSVNEHFFKNRKIDVSFSRAVNKKEKEFLKFLFNEYRLSEKLEKGDNILSGASLEKIMGFLKFSDIPQLQKFLNNLQSKKILFSVHSAENLVITGNFSILASYNIIYSKINFIFSQELMYSYKKNTLFSYLKFDFLIFIGNKEVYNFYTFLLSHKNDEKSLEADLTTVKKILNVENQYERFFDFENRILKKAVEDINFFTSLSVEYGKVKVGVHKNNRVEKLVFKISDKNRKIESEKNIILTRNINSIMDLVKSDINDFRSTYSLIKSYLIRKGYGYVYHNTLFTKKYFKSSIEKNLRKVLLLDLSGYLSSHSVKVSKEMAKEFIELYKKINEFQKN